jgi:NAD-dependent DNA ligase
VLYDEHDIKKPADLYRLTYGQLSQVQLGGRVVGTGAKQVLAEIEKSKQCPLADLVGSVGIKFLGRREAENILEKLGISQLDDLYLVTPEELTRVGYNLKAQIIVDGLKKARPVIDALLEAGVTVPKSKKAPAPALSQGGVLSGHTVVFTGAIQKCDASGTRYTRKKMQELALSAGASVLDDVREGVTMLVLADPDSTSSKTKKAMKLGVKLVHENDFFSMVGL